MYSLLILFCSLISVSKKRNIETMLTIPYSNHCQKFNNKMNEKGRQEYRSMDPEYVTGPINSRILKLLWRWFCRLIFDKTFSQRPQKIFQPFTSVDTVLSGSYKSLLNNLWEPWKQVFKKRFRTVNKSFWLTSMQGLPYMKTMALGLKLVYSFINFIIPLPVTSVQHSWCNCQRVAKHLFK